MFEHQRSNILLYYLGSTAEYRTIIATLFGVSKSFKSFCVKDVARAIVRKLKAFFLFVPEGKDLKDIMTIYRGKWGFPACAGAIDGTHVLIQAPSENPIDYVNRVVGWPGSVHDPRVLSNADLYFRGQQGLLFDDSVKVTLLRREIIK